MTSRAADGADLRTTAFLQPARNFLDDLGIWQYFSPETMPLDIMRIVDAGGAENPPRMRVEKEFNSSEVSDLPFGWNIPNTAARAALMTRMDDLENLTFLTGHSCERLFTRGEARVTLSNGIAIAQNWLWRQMGAIPPCANNRGSLCKPHVLGKRHWPLPCPTPFRMKMYQQKFIAQGGHLPWSPCPITMACPVPRLFGWKRPQRPRPI